MAARSVGHSHVLIAGGGVAALEAALALRALAEERVEVELLAPDPLFWYRPLAAAEPFRPGAARHFELADVVAATGATLTTGALAAVDVEHRLARTFAGADVPYDALVIACGAVPVPSVPGALTFRGPADTSRLAELLDEVERGEVHRLAFAVPAADGWTLAAYELALLTADWAEAHTSEHLELVLVTPEEAPLQVFGPAAAAAVAGLLESRGVVCLTASHSLEFRDGELLLVGGDAVAADRVVALPRLRGRRIDGIAQNPEGFIPVDTHARVFGSPDVYAAGDATSFPLKQGGIAAQQAEAAAESIAAAAGARVLPRPFRPVLRGLLLTGREPLYLRRELTWDPGETPIGTDPLWWPPTKIVGRHLAPFLGALAGDEAARELRAGADAVPVHVELDSTTRGASRFEALLRAADAFASDDEPDATAADAMETEIVLVTADRTLGEAAALMREHDLEVALVMEDGELVGILTARDLLRAIAGRADARTTLVRHFMTAEPLTVPSSAAAAAAVFLMSEYGVHHLPIVDDGRPVGMLTLGAATRVARRRLGVGLGF
jgi:sulfide:quinone oxidoreductase